MAATTGANYSQGKPVGSATKESALKLAASVYSWVTAIIWRIYVTFLAGPTRLLIPEHTRDASFQLWCDLRTNVPKDQNWLMRRLSALKPRTPSGWIALGAFALFASAGGCVLLCCSLVALALATYTALGIGIVAGLVAAATMLFFAGVFFVATLVTGWLAACTLAGYAWLRLVVATSKFAYNSLKRFAPAQGTHTEEDKLGATVQTSGTAPDSWPAAPPTPQQSEAQAAPPSATPASAEPRVLPTDTSPAASDVSSDSDATLPESATSKQGSASGGGVNRTSKGKADGKQAKLQAVQDLPGLQNRIPQPVS